MRICFHKNTNNNYVLLISIYLSSLQAGPLGALQVDEDHLKQGLGTLVCQALTRELGQMGLDVCSCVGFDNSASNRLFTRIGFEVVDVAHWTRTNPTVPTEWTD